jgi:polysaccharide biosynthesis protein PslG
MHPGMKILPARLAAMIVIVAMITGCGGGNENTPTADPTATSMAAIATATPLAGDASPVPTTAADTSATVPASTPTNVPPIVATATPAVSVTAEPTRPSSVDHRESEFAFGWNVGFRGDENGAEHNARTIEMVNDSGFEWVRFQLEWSQFQRQRGSWDPLPMDRVIDQAHAEGLKILVVVAKAPEWALDSTGSEFLADYSEFTQLMAFVADRYRGKVQAWEIWNEQNLAHEMAGTVRVTDYFNLLRAGHIGIRLSDPDALIVFGGLTPNGVNDPSVAIDDLLYLQEIYAMNGGRITDYFDILGVHLNSTHNPPDTMWPDNPSNADGWNDHESFYFRRAEQLRQVMLAHGDDDTPVWITEFGWTTENQAPGYEYGVNNSETDVAEYLTGALEIARYEWDFVAGAFVWNLNWSTLASPDDEIYPWSALNGDWSPRPAYEALRAFDKE